MKLFRWLMLPHYLYFLSLPSLALVATAMLGEKQGAGSLCLFGLIPVAVFISLMAYSYTLPQDWLEALDYVFSVPLRIGLSCWFLDGGVWEFIAQVTAVEVGAFACALGYVELYEQPLTIEGVSSVLLAAIVFILLLLNVLPFMVMAWQGAKGATPLWIVFFLAAASAALRQHARRLTTAAQAFKESFAPAENAQTPQLRALSRWLGVTEPAPPERLATLESALPTMLIFLLIYLLTPMFSGIFLH